MKWLRWGLLQGALPVPGVAPEPPTPGGCDSPVPPARQSPMTPPDPARGRGDHAELVPSLAARELPT